MAGVYRDSALLKVSLAEMFKDMTEEERNVLSMNFPFPDPKDVGTAESTKEFRRRRHPRRKGSLREFIEDPQDSQQSGCPMR